MRSEKINLADRKLIGEWHHNNSRKQLIIVCHGYEGLGDNPTITTIANGLNQNAHDTFTFNFSKNTGGFDIEHQVHDIKLIVEYFKGKGYEEFVLVAHSFAALTAAIATIKFSTIKRLVTLNGFFGQGDLGENHRKAYLKFRVAALAAPKYRKILKYYSRELQPSSISVPVLVIHSKVDKQVFIRQSQDFYQKLVCPKQFIELKDANHGIVSEKDRKSIVSGVHGWLRDS